MLYVIFVQYAIQEDLRSFRTYNEPSRSEIDLLVDDTKQMVSMFFSTCDRVNAIFHRPRVANM